MRILTPILLALLALPATATAQDWRAEASPYDIERIESAPRALELALATARAKGERKDIATLDAILGPARPVEGEALLGDWRCRTIKLGGQYVALIVYGWFKCRIAIAADGLFFEKVTGSQRTAGYLRPVYPASGEGLPTHYIYLGAAHYGREPQRAYLGPANLLRRVPDNTDDPGILEAVGGNHVRIGFPLPVYESEYNLLELRR